MRLTEVGIHNYKSLRSVSMALKPLSVLVGANGAGKSNFCDALDFLGEMYRWGLELAVARHGGYENICHRHNRRSKSPIRFQVNALFDDAESNRLFPPSRERERRSRVRGDLALQHLIEFRASSQKIQAPFRVEREKITLSLRDGASPDRDLIRIERFGDAIVNSDMEGLVQIGQVPPEMLAMRRSASEFPLVSTQSLIQYLDRLVPFPFFYPLNRSLGSIGVFQLGPAQCRQAGVPTPNPQLDRSGGNLPAVIDFIKVNRADQYQALLTTLKRVMPALDGLSVAVTPNKTLGLSFHERGFGSPWTAEDVSDGTIRAVALLAAIFDPALNVLVVEEPENSLHPWAIRQFVDACRVAATTKQLILTTHSPVLINHLSPEEIWVVTRPEAETKVQALTHLDPDAMGAWEGGKFSLAEYLDSGTLPSAVPAEPT